MNITDNQKSLFLEIYFAIKKCPTCGLNGKKMKCQKCGRDACDNCIAFDLSDCIVCGPHGDIAKECFGIKD